MPNAGLYRHLFSVDSGRWDLLSDRYGWRCLPFRTSVLYTHGENTSHAVGRMETQEALQSVCVCACVCVPVRVRVRVCVHVQALDLNTPWVWLISILRTMYKHFFFGKKLKYLDSCFLYFFKHIQIVFLLLQRCGHALLLACLSLLLLVALFWFQASPLLAIIIICELVWNSNFKTPESNDFIISHYPSVTGISFVSVRWIV